MIDPAAPQRGRANADRVLQLETLKNSNAGEVLAKLVFENREIVSLIRQARIWNMTQNEVEQVLQAPPFHPGNFVRLSRDGDQLILSTAQWTFYQNKMVEVLATMHRSEPEQGSIGIDRLQSSLGNRVPVFIFPDILNACCRIGDFVQSGSQVRLSAHRPILSSHTQKDWSRLEALMQDRLPLRSEIQKELGFDVRKIEVLTRPEIQAGRLFEIGEKRLALSSTLRARADQIADLANKGAFTVIDAKQAFGLGRDPTIEILEFFDRIEYTVRRGNSRSLAKPEVIALVLNG